MLRSYSWPGNVRELRTAIEHGVVMSNDHVIDTRHLPYFLNSPETQTSGKEPPTTPPTAEMNEKHENSLASEGEFNLHVLEMHTIRRALHHTDNNPHGCSTATRHQPTHPPKKTQGTRKQPVTSNKQPCTQAPQPSLPSIHSYEYFQICRHDSLRPSKNHPPRDLLCHPRRLSCRFPSSSPSKASHPHVVWNKPRSEEKSPGVTATPPK